MPKMMGKDDTQVIDIKGPGSFKFSAIRIEELGATEYTLVTIVCDISGSVIRFADDLLDAIKSIIEACQKSPRSENLLLRILLFNENIIEVHGFINLGDIDINSYSPLYPDGMTSLFDATYDAVCATLEYSKRLIDQDFDCNGAIYIITDGMDNRSTMTPKSIKDKNTDAMLNEEIESNVIIVVALKDPQVNKQQQVIDSLERFCKDAGLTQFIDIGDATAGKLAKLANFVSESISSQSQALGTGAPSQTLTF